jgi:hypothetical protein
MRLKALDILFLTVWVVIVVVIVVDQARKTRAEIKRIRVECLNR